MFTKHYFLSASVLNVLFALSKLISIYHLICDSHCCYSHFKDEKNGHVNNLSNYLMTGIHDKDRFGTQVYSTPESSL